MEKMLFNTTSGNLYEVLVSGGGPDYRSFVVEIFQKEKNKWIRAGIKFDTVRGLTDEKIIELAKEMAEQSIFE
jgi:MoaA/NifB/PqqE/SkfB family radical SAM enzyme